MSYMERELYHILGVYLKEAREKSGLTLTDVSEVIGTTPMTIQRYEKGDRKITIEKVRELCRCYKADSDALMQKAVTEFKALYSIKNSEPASIAAHHEEEEWSDEELAEIERFKEFVRSKRNSYYEEAQRIAENIKDENGVDPLEGMVFDEPSKQEKVILSKKALEEA